LQRFYLGESGAVLRSVGIQEPAPEELGTVVKAAPLNTLFFPQPFGPELLIGYGPDATWATAVSSRFDITGYAAGSVVWTVSSQAPVGPTLSPEDQAWAHDRIASYLEIGGGVRSDYPPVPDRKPPLAALNFDEAGRMWVIFNTAGDEPARASLYDRLGSPVGVRTWPRAVDLSYPAWLAADYALGIVKDTLGVQRVARVAWQSGSGE
jgi:hypothetical protein